MYLIDLKYNALQILAIGLWFSIELVHGLDNGLARTPPMGWISWERFTCDTDCETFPNECIDAKLYKDMADRMVSDGYLEAGYQYVNIDDCWSEKRRDLISDALVPDHKRFPARGFEELSKYIHGKGLKFGLYGDCGTATCAGYPGLLKHKDSLFENYFILDANRLAWWEADSFKMDGCNIDPIKAESLCPIFSRSLNATARPILLTCEWPFYMLRQSFDHKPNWTLAQESCNTWRYYEDVEDSWLSILSIIDFTVKIQTDIARYHGPGHWFDPDQLVIGNFGLSYEQSKAQMAIWSMWSAPLYMSNDLRSITPEMAYLLKHKKLIEINQDKLGVFGLMVEQNGQSQAFVKPIEPIKNGCPSFAIAYLYRGTLGNSKNVTFDLRTLLRKAPIGLAAQRFKELRGAKESSDEFTMEACRNKLANAMTIDSNSIPQDLVVKPKNHETKIPLEQSIVEFRVEDLFSDSTSTSVFLNETLSLMVNPSGVTIVKLVQADSK